MSQSLNKGLPLKEKMKNINTLTLSPVNKFKHLITNELQNSFIIYTYIYRDIFKATDVFTALHFTVTGASLATKCTRILLMTQHA
jgi:hypothetical protein